VEPIKPVYNNIKVIILVVIPIIISSSNSIKSPIQGNIIIRPIIYSNLSTNKKTEYQEKYNRFWILEKDYNKKVNILTDVINNI
jgi:hypothetical protein